MVLTLCNWRWWCFSCHPLAQIPHLHLQWALPAICANFVFLVPTSTFYKCVHMNCNHAATFHCMQLALVGVSPLPIRHLLMCIHTEMSTLCSLHSVVCGGDFMTCSVLCTWCVYVCVVMCCGEVYNIYCICGSRVYVVVVSAVFVWWHLSFTLWHVVCGVVSAVFVWLALCGSQLCVCVCVCAVWCVCIRSWWSISTYLLHINLSHMHAGMNFTILCYISTDCTKCIHVHVYEFLQSVTIWLYNRLHKN